MKNFEFKSQVATTREQSQRLLALGLKKETADCALFLNGNNEFEQLSNFGDWERYADMFPAWSLHRLIELYSDVEDTSSLSIKDVSYKLLIFCIEMAIHCRLFNQDYLEKK